MLSGTDPIDVLIVHWSASRHQGGTLTFLRYLLKYLRRDWFQPTLLLLSNGELADDFRAQGYDVRVLEAGRFRKLHRTVDTIWAIHSLIGHEKFSLVFSNGALEHLYAGTAAWMSRVPGLWYCHGCAAEGPDVVATLTSLIPATKVFTHGDYTMSLLSKRCRAPIRVIPYGIDLPNLNGCRPSIRKELAFGPEVPVLTMVGVFMEWKGQDVFIQAAPRVLKEFPTAKFLLVGDVAFERHRPYAEYLRRLVKELDLQEHVIFLGFRNDAFSIMASSDIIVHASTSPEPFGIVILEAMAAEKPVITTGLGGAQEIVRDGESGISVPPRDPIALAEACLRFLKDSDLRRNMGKVGRGIVERDFTAEAMVKKIEKSFFEALAKQSFMMLRVHN